MPEPSDRGTLGITRRQGLIALAVVGSMGMLAACTTTEEPGPPSGSGSSAEPSSGDALAARVAADEAALIARYDSILAARPAIDPAAAALLAAIRDEHVQHRDALGGTAAPSSPAPAISSASAGLSELPRAERQASRSRVRACEDAQEPELARLLAFIAASEAAHVPALRDVGA